MVWTTEHRIFAVKRYFENGHSVTQTQRDFRLHFNIGPRRRLPCYNVIMGWVKAFETTGSVNKRKSTGRKRSARIPENIDRVRQATIESPGRSIRLRAASLAMSETSVRRILKKDLHFHPYKIQIVQQLNEEDYQQRVNFAQDMLDIVRTDETSILFMSDEAHFHINGYVNKQNSRYWSEDNPRILHETPLHSPKVTVWCAVGEKGVIGPYFFEEHGETVTVTSPRYIDMLNNFFLPELCRRRFMRRHILFQQDGATAHTARASMALVKREFPGHVISRFGDIPYPPRSPDFSMCDFFLWGYLKSKVYVNKPRTLDELKNEIRRVIQEIPRQMLEKAYRSFTDRLQMCITLQGRHLSDVIFKN